MTCKDEQGDVHRFAMKKADKMPTEGDIATLPSPSGTHTTVFSCDVSLNPKLDMRFGNACNDRKVATGLICL